MMKYHVCIVEGIHDVHVLQKVLRLQQFSSMKLQNQSAIGIENDILVSQLKKGEKPLLTYTERFHFENFRRVSPCLLQPYLEQSLLSDIHS